MLQYIYGFETHPFGIDLPFAKEIIETADRYGVTNLKLEAEATYVSILTLTLENVMENLLFAESKNCALVKEEAMNFIVLNKVEVLKKNMLIDAPGGLYADILSAVVRSEGKAGSLRLEDKFVSMNISELRRQANNKGLEFDGSREALISALGYYESGDM